MNIHFVADSPRINSGYSNQVINLASGLKSLGHNITITGRQTNYTAEKYEDFDILPLDTRYILEKDQYALNYINTESQVSIHVYQSDLDNSLTKVFPNTIFYTTIEGSRVPKFSLQDFQFIVENRGKIVVPSNFGKDEIIKTGKYFNISFTDSDLLVIPYGYNPNIFYHISNLKSKSNSNSYRDLNVDPNEKLITLKWSKENKKWQQYQYPILEFSKQFSNKFLFLSVGHNMGIRKRHDILLAAYTKLINESNKLKDRTHLHIHTLPMAVDGMNLLEEIMILSKDYPKSNVEENITFSYSKFGPSGYYSDQLMNILYNTADIYVSSSSGEGFGIPVLNSMATGKPVIATNYTSFPELIGDNNIDNIDNIATKNNDINKNDTKNNTKNNNGDKARGLLVNCTPNRTQTSSYKAIADIDDLSQKMKLLYNNKELREQYSKNCLEFAKNYTWDKIIPKWDILIKTFQ